MNHTKNKYDSYFFSMNHTFIKYESYLSMKPRFSRDSLAELSNPNTNSLHPNVGYSNLYPVVLEDFQD